ncbi:uncharacterized protein C8R40DRAFT_1066724 [Lentinula edodes]|uniref:uncharacterized protein n=1 Tax=Lentinula edodes TaxID=5353 RepID=UPI001E8DD871|nr:uncharacterized protein C8R40DRAFT_1066724 [Lentinula edodes]KAH7878986.1 hypothetical protein C8R40DRAFT_1066724 [Lentinula edodes]
MVVQVNCLPLWPRQIKAPKLDDCAASVYYEFESEGKTSRERKDFPLDKIPENNLTISDPEHIIQAFLRLLVKLDTTLYVDISFERFQWNVHPFTASSGIPHAVFPLDQSQMIVQVHQWIFDIKAKRRRAVSGITLVVHVDLFIAVLLYAI